MTAHDPVDGRPTEGAALAASFEAAGDRRPKSRNLSPLKTLWPFVLGHAGDAIAAVLFLLVSTASTLAITGAARLVVDHGFDGRNAADLNRYFLILTAVAVVLATATAGRYYFVTRLGERVVADVRKALYRHVLTLDQAFFLKTRTGEVLSRMTADITLIETFLTTSISLGLRNGLSAVGALALLMVVSPRLTLFVLLLGPVVLVPMLLYGRRVRSLTVRSQDLFAGAMGYAGETLDALETIQAFGQERPASGRFGEAVENAFAASRQRIGARAIMTFLVMVLVFGGVAAILFAGAHAVLNGTMSAGQLLQFVFLSVLAAGSVGALAEVWGDVQKGAGAMERIGEILTARPDISAPAAPTPLPYPPRGEVRFEDVRFNYPARPDLPALAGVSFELRPGERVALVGPSGSGKSTVLRLLLRFYDPQTGAIRLDGVDLRAADPAEVRARLALVAQDSPLFSGSALDNIRFGRSDASMDAARAAARAAQAEGFIDALPEGFESAVGERGRTLSGGQRQRLAIARALIREAPILLLDEATSALDAESERLVQAALDQAMTGRTTLVIAHRLSTVLNADRILVMDEGRIVEEGRHADLVAKGGLYARLARLQFGADAA
jgi:ATP-binding cassette, subfamily B, bacterial